MAQIKSAKLFIGTVDDPDKYEPVCLVDVSPVFQGDGVKIKGTLSMSSAGWVWLMKMRAEQT